MFECHWRSFINFYFEFEYMKHRTTKRDAKRLFGDATMPTSKANNPWERHKSPLNTLVPTVSVEVVMRSRPDLPRGKGTFDWWRSRRWRSGFKSARFEPCNCYTIAPFVINQAQFDWPRQEGFSCKWIEEHKQEDVITQSDIANIDEVNHKRGSRTQF